MSCPDCFSGHVHAGTPKGRVEKVHGLDTYISDPPEGTAPKGIIIIVPDAFGFPFVNNRILADHYAEKGGFLVYLPEFMDGHAAPVWSMDNMKSLLFDKSWTAILAKPYHLFWMLYGMIPFTLRCSFTITWPRVQSFFTAVRQHEGAALPIGAAGFCWGGQHTVQLAHPHLAPNNLPLIDAGFTGHPSRLSIPGDFGAVVKPLSFALGDKDIVVSASQIPVIRKAIVEEKEGDAKGEVVVYHGASHGFCVRADLVLDDAERQAREAEEQAVAWFQRCFARVEY